MLLDCTSGLQLQKLMDFELFVHSSTRWKSWGPGEAGDGMSQTDCHADVVILDAE